MAHPRARKPGAGVLKRKNEKRKAELKRRRVLKRQQTQQPRGRKRSRTADRAVATGSQGQHGALTVSRKRPRPEQGASEASPPSFQLPDNERRRAQKQRRRRERELAAPATAPPHHEVTGAPAAGAPPPLPIGVMTPALPPCSTPVPGFAPPQWQLLYDPAAIERHVRPLLDEPAIGIDIEWRPTYVAGRPPNPVALLQLSSHSRCVLVPVRHLRGRLPPVVAQLLASPSVWKVGCGVAEDARKIQTDCGMVCQPTLEIGEVATRLQSREGLVFPSLPADEAVRPGLRGLALACGFDLQKPKRVSRSNWELRPLTAEQQRYAALDAYCGVWIAKCLHALHQPHAAASSLPQWLASQSEQLRTYKVEESGERKARLQAHKRAKKAAARAVAMSTP